jgi:hypothetical protein
MWVMAIGIMAIDTMGIATMPTGSATVPDTITGFASPDTHIGSALVATDTGLGMPEFR